MQKKLETNRKRAVLRRSDPAIWSSIRWRLRDRRILPGPRVKVKVVSAEIQIQLHVYIYIYVCTCITERERMYIARGYFPTKSF